MEGEVDDDGRKEKIFGNESGEMMMMMMVVGIKMFFDEGW